MNNIAIRVEGLSKQYSIGNSKNERYATFRETLTRGVSSIFQKVSRKTNLAETKETDSNYFYALKDVSFEVESGEVIGIIGKNGAGKSTLLKILSRITDPTEGYADIHGRVGSLL